MAARSATELVGQLAHTEEIKGAIRDSGGILALMRQLKQEGAPEASLEVVTRALTMVTINNKANQDYLRCGRAARWLTRRRGCTLHRALVTPYHVDNAACRCISGPLSGTYGNPLCVWDAYA